MIVIHFHPETFRLSLSSDASVFQGTFLQDRVSTPIASRPGFFIRCTETIFAHTQSEAVAAAGVCFCAELTRVEHNQASLVHAGTLALVKWAAGAHPDNAVLKTLLPMVQVCVCCWRPAGRPIAAPRAAALVMIF